MRLYNLHYSMEQAVLRLAKNRAFRKEVAPLIFTPRWNELLKIPEKWGVSWQCVCVTMEYLYGMWFGRYGDHVCKVDKSPASIGVLKG